MQPVCISLLLCVTLGHSCEAHCGAHHVGHEVLQGDSRSSKPSRSPAFMTVVLGLGSSWWRRCRCGSAVCCAPCWTATCCPAAGACRPEQRGEREEPSCPCSQAGQTAGPASVSGEQPPAKSATTDPVLRPVVSRRSSTPVIHLPPQTVKMRGLARKTRRRS